MKSFAQQAPDEAVNSRSRAVVAPGGRHFELLRRSLDLPSAAMVGDALHFLIGPDMNVVALLSDGGRILLMVELIEMKSLDVGDWQRLAMHLSSHFDDDHMGRIIVLDGRLSMAWSYSVDLEPELWVQDALQAMAWCTGARSLLNGSPAPVRQ